MASKPTIVFSLGAWTLPPAFDLIKSKLKERDIESIVPGHPSIGAEPPSKTLSDDVESLRLNITGLVEVGKEVIVVAHSYGGVVASCAVEGLGRSERQADGLEGGVVMVVYVAAFVLDKGVSLLDMLGGDYLAWMRVNGDYVNVDNTTASDIGFHDLPEPSQKKYLSELTHTSRLVFSGSTTYEPWHTIPCAYILCTEDRGLPAQLQEIMAAKMKTEHMYRLESSHWPFLSMSDRVADVLEELIEKTQRKSGSDSESVGSGSGLSDSS